MATSELLQQLDRAIIDASAKHKEWLDASSRETNAAQALQTARNTVSELRQRLDVELNTVVGVGGNHVRVSA